MRWARSAWRPALLVAGLVGAGFVLRAAGLGMAGQSPAGLVAIGALACAAGIPRQAVAYAGGLAFGLWPGAGLALLAQLLGCMIDVVWARLVARRWAERVLSGRLARLDRFVAARPFTATLTLRLLPVGSNVLLNLLAGVSGVAAAPFFAGSALGYLPQTVIFALLGAGVRVGHGAQVAIAVALFALSLVLGTLLMRSRRRVSASEARAAR